MSIVSHLECPEFKGKVQKNDKKAGNSLHFYYNPGIMTSNKGKLLQYILYQFSICIAEKNT